MADSSTNVDTILTAQSNKEVTANNYFDAASPAIMYGRRAVSTTGLTWGFYGGRYNGTLIANGTVALTASSTNYVVANRSTGVVSTSTAITNWNDTAGFIRLYQVVTGTSTVTSYQDWRQTYGGAAGVTFPLLAPNGTVSAPSYAFSAAASTGMFRDASDRICFAFGNSNANLLLDGGTGFQGCHIYFTENLNQFILGNGSSDITLQANTGGDVFINGSTFVNLRNSMAALRVNNNQVIGARVTGWGAPTGTISRAALTLTAAASYSQADFDTVIQALKAVITDLRTHGLINT